MSHNDIGRPSDIWAIGDGSVISQLKRNRHKSRTEFDLPPMWGTSRLRDETTKTDGSGAVQASESGGEIKLETGADGTDRIELRSVQYAQYRSGLYGDASFGIRPGSQPSGQTLQWGYYDDNSGYGWGYDSTGIFTFRRENGNDTIYRPSDDATSDASAWHLDDLDGQNDENNPSGINHDPLDGAVYHVVFRLYGYGPVRWYVEARDSTGDVPTTRPVEVDRREYEGELNLVDFNRQLRAEIDNDGTDAAQTCFIGGRQFSLLGETTDYERRAVTPIVRGYQVAVNNSYEPLLAVRKKTNFPSGTTRGNSVRTRIATLTGRSNGNGELALTLDATVDNADNDWTTPERWSAEETAIEVIDGTTTTISTSAPGLQVLHMWMSGANNNAETVSKTAQLDLGSSITAVVWGRTASSNVTFDTSLSVQEQW